MRTIRLREWQTSVNLTLDGRERDALRSLLGVTVQPTPGTADRYDVTPGNKIGAVLTGETTLLVQPKLPIHQVLFLLGYAADPQGWRDGNATLTDAPDLVTGVAALYARVCDRALARGLLHGYHSVETDLTTVRGRIDLARQLRRRPGVDVPLAVRFQDYDEDIAENQLLLAAASTLRTLPIRSPSARRSLHRLRDTMRNVTLTEHAPGAIPTVTYTRLNRHYRPAVELARMILTGRSIDLRPGRVETPSLVIDMAVVFEEFVRRAIREAIGASEDQFPSGSNCPHLALDIAGRVRLQPDLSYWPTGGCAFVGDVKYKRDSGQGSNADLYQLLAYAIAAALPQATLIYADGPPSPASHYVAGAGVRLVVEHLDLTLTPPRLLQAIDPLAEQVRAAAVAAYGAG